MIMLIMVLLILPSALKVALAICTARELYQEIWEWKATTLKV
jgi:hypothetical protein